MARRRWLAPIAAWATVVALLAGALGWIPSTAAPAAQQASPVASPVASPQASPVATPVALNVFASGPFRIAVVAAARAAAFADLGLSARDGREWCVVIVDATNWGAAAAIFAPREFAIDVVGAESTNLAPKSTETAAKRLKLEPGDVDKGVQVKRGASTRVVLAFLLDAGGVQPHLTTGAERMPLDAVIASGGDLAALPPAASPPVLERVTVRDVPSGDTLQLTTGTVSLAGVDAPLPEECFGGQATRRLEQLAGGTVSIERDPANPGSVFAWVDRADGDRLLLNREMLGSGFGALATGLSGPYAAWLTAVADAARTGNAGLWGACTSQHGVARPQGPDLRALTIKPEGVVRPYQVWIAWNPLLITKPDGSAWAFFSAEPTEGSDVGHKRLYACHFDPATGAWSDGLPMPGGEIQMGPAAVVDAQGLVHLVYIDRAKDEEGIFSKIVYTTENGTGGWTVPVPVSDNPTAGYQLSPSLAIDGSGTLHVLWQDQRNFSAEAQLASAANADIFASDLPPGGTWSEPVLVNTHFVDAVGSRPHVVVDGDRLVAVWSVYAAALGLEAAARVDWATRPLDDEDGWTTPQPLIVGRGDKFGGRLVDMTADPNGGVVLVFGRQATDTFLQMRRLPPGANTWSGDMLITFGDRGAFPTVAVATTGNVYIAYNAGTGGTVDVGAVAVPFRSIEPGPEIIVTQDQVATQGRPMITVDEGGNPWLIYFNEPPGGVANAVMVLRNAQIPATVAEAEALAVANATPAASPTPAG